MPKARHRKRTRPSPLATAASSAPDENGSSASASAAPKEPKVGKKESEVTNLLDKLRSDKVEERIWASSALSSLLLTLPPVTLRLLLSKNLIGLLIERLADPEDEVVIECLGSLRNLAVSSPPSVLSEMHNKRLLLPLTTTHLPLLLSLLPSLLGPAPAPHVAPLPSTPEQRVAAEILNSRNEKRRRLFWDWSENVLMLLWCLAESNTKILASLNATGDKLVEFTMAFLDAKAMGLSEGDTDGMDVEGAKKGKKGKKVAGAKERVPLFVALAAAHTLHAFISSNIPACTLLLAHPSLPSLALLLTTPTAPLTTTQVDSHHSTPASDADDFLTLRVLSFGILLEVSKGKKQSELRETFKSNEEILMGLLKSDLAGVASASIQVVKELPATETPGAISAPATKLASYEKKLSTLQLSLEILGEWCATLDTDALGDAAEEEEWGGIPMEDGEDDVEMDEGDEGDDNEGADEDSMDEESASDAAVELSSSALTLFASLPSLLLALSTPTSLSFHIAPFTATAPGLIPTSTTSADLPIPLSAVADLLTTIHVRALECLNNLYITLARALASPSATTASFLSDKARIADLQAGWEGVLGMVQGALVGQMGPERKEDEGEDRRMEVVMAGVGAAWGMARVGLGEGGRLTVGPSATPFLVEVFSHPFATAATPAGEAIRVRIAGALGWMGRRKGIDGAENEMIGAFLLSLLPSGKTPSPLAPTPEVLLQAIDSLIDLYSDEESSYDAAVFRAKGFLERLESAVTGVRAASKKIDRKKFPELRSRADGALENLEAFVEYRKDIV